MQVWHGSDWAVCEGDRRSTTGIRATIGDFKVLHASSTQPGLPSLSSVAAELRAMTRAASEGLYLFQAMCEMQMEPVIKLPDDSSAALAIILKLGPGRTKHLETMEYFVKESSG